MGAAPEKSSRQSHRAARTSGANATTTCRLTSTYAGGGIDENWHALFRTLALFRSAARAIADDLGYAYPEELDRRVTAYVHAMRTAEPEATT